MIDDLNDRLYALERLAFEGVYNQDEWQNLIQETVAQGRLCKAAQIDKKMRFYAICKNELVPA